MIISSRDEQILHPSSSPAVALAVEPVKASELPERFCSFKRGGQTVYVIVREVNERTQKAYISHYPIISRFIWC